MERQPVVIIGSGLAGYTLAREFRKLDTGAPLVILSADHGGFYSKPLLSNGFAQKKTADSLLAKDAARMAEELQAEVRPHANVTAIDPQRKQLLVNGETLPYGRLVLALGADPIRLPLTGSGAEAVLSVNDLDDYRRFLEAVEGKRRIAILGAGLIGCEFANDLSGAGYAVDVIDLATQPLGRLLPPAAGAFMQRRLESAGIVFRLGTSIQQINREETGFRLMLANGEVIEADAVLSAVGLRPRTSLAAAADIRINRGIVVDQLLQTNQEDIYALGDCAEVAGKVLPFVMPIIQAARALAATLAGNPTPVHYPAMPVAVKTPACPAVVAPPEPTISGQWRMEENQEGVKALFEDGNDKLRGFALLGAATIEKRTLTQLLA